MSVVKEYIRYIKDNPEGYWFKRKAFGWGWVPATWQGWLVTLVFLLAVLALATTVDENASEKEVTFTFLLPLAFLTITFIRIAYWKGERPKWNWGLPKKDAESVE